MNSIPHFLIIGAQKAGTTSLHEYLNEHPDVALPPEKELHYFDVNYSKGDDWYRDQFSALDLKEGQITGESSPYYVFHPLVPGRIRSYDPDIRLIVLLREPSARAVSHYFHALKMGFESMSFDDALRMEGERLKGEELKMLKDPEYFSYSHQHHSYISRGFYALQLNHWLNYFDRDQLLILNSDDLFSNTQLIYSKVLTFLGLGQYSLKKMEAHNAGDKENEHSGKILQLKPFYKEANEQLFELIGEDYGWNAE